jgi:hypothetical protein
MTIKKAACLGMMSASFLALLSAATATTAVAQPAAGQQVKIDADDIGGVVTGAKGPEAGVWVIAETRDLPTKYVKIVATDDAGRYVIPDLPKGTYDVWVRGYGLVDSPKVKAQPGKTVDLKSVQAPNRAAAAAIYPGIYWYAMMKIPPANLFPGTGPSGNGMSVTLKDQGQWLRFTKTDGCGHCHQLGDLATRTIPADLGHFNTSAEAWERRLESGQAGRNMMEELAKLDVQRQLGFLGDWSDRISKGELPKSDPARPVGQERNVVVTEWDWENPRMYVHDTISTDRRNPTVNGHGLIYGAPEVSSDNVPWLDPVDNKAGFIKSEYRDPKTPTSKTDLILQPSPYWGNEAIWDSHTIIHNPMFDENGRVWLTARIRPQPNPAFCKEGSDQPSAKIYPKNTSNRQVEVYDPKTQKITMVDLCFNTHHLQFDKNDTLWFSAGGNYDVIGWLDVKKWEATHDDKMSQGWSPFIIDTNANGKRDAGWTEPNQPNDPAKDKRMFLGFYGVAPNPADGTIWGGVTGFPGGIARFDPKTQLTEYYEFPYKNAKNPQSGFSPRGSDIDSNGVFWAVLSSGHLASFDRRLCKGKLNGPAANDPQNLCPEGFKLYQMPGPEFENLPKGTPGASAEAPYYVWVDQHNTFGLGENVPIATGNNSDSLNALVNGKWMVMRIPYPLSFYAKNLDGRIDDMATGWKGRGLWSQYSGRSQPHLEGGKGQQSKVVHVQYRPDPLAH